MRAAQRRAALAALSAAMGEDLSGVVVEFRPGAGVLVSVHQDDSQMVLRLLDALGLAVDDADEPHTLPSGVQVVGFRRAVPGSLAGGLCLDWYLDADAAGALRELDDYDRARESDRWPVGA